MNQTFNADSEVEKVIDDCPRQRWTETNFGSVDDKMNGVWGGVKERG